MRYGLYIYYKIITYNEKKALLDFNKRTEESKQSYNFTFKVIIFIYVILSYFSQILIKIQEKWQIAICHITLQKFFITRQLMVNKII
jgi:hypothetical protein